VTVTLPCDLHDQVRQKADVLGTDFQTAIATLLRIGLRAQATSESEISQQVEQLMDQDASEGAETTARIGELIFGS
jgi:hypothetical protein